MEETKMKNPWLGLESYKEGEVLYGRDDDIRDLSQCVLNDTDTLLYGKSGIGKSSILNAGIIPAARRYGFLPVLVRFSHKEKQAYLCQIKDAIANAMIPIPLDESGNLIILSVEEEHQRETELGKRIVKVVDSKDPNKESLYEFFHSNTFHDADGKRIKLLIIFDQFEEIFTLQTDESSKKRFFAELADFLNDVMPTELQHAGIPTTESQKKKTIIGAGNFGNLFNDLKLGVENNLPEYISDNEIHLVFTIREDFLSEFEYYSSAIPSLKQNRYGLRPINEEQAAQIIMRPMPGLIDESVAKLIIEKVTGRTDFELDSIPEIEVDSAVLSLYLNRLYDAKTGSQITSVLVEDKGGKIIADFYNDAISGISESTVEYLEDLLLNGQGRRDNITIFDAINDGGVTEKELDILCNKKKILRQFNYAGDLRIEYVHDILCPVVKAHKDERILLKQQELERKRQEEEKQRILAEAEKKQRELEEKAARERIEAEIKQKEIEDKAEENERLRNQREEITATFFLFAFLVFIIWLITTISQNWEVAKGIGIFKSLVTQLAIANLSALPFIIYSSVKKLRMTFWLSLYGIISNTILIYLFLHEQTEEIGLRYSISIMAIGIPITSLFYSYKYNLYGIPDKKELKTIETSIPLWLLWWIISSYIFFLCCFNIELGLPEPSNSFWGVCVIPFFTYKIIGNFFKQQKQKTVIFVLSLSLISLTLNTCSVPFVFSAIQILCIIIVILLSYLWAYKSLSWKKRITAFFLNFCVLCTVVIMNIGFNPINIKYDSVSHVYNWIDVTVQNQEKYFGIVSAWSGDTILPCLFDSINYKRHNCYINSRKLTYKDSIKSIDNLYEYKKDTKTAMWTIHFIDMAELYILKYKNESNDTTHLNSLHEYAAKTYYEVRNSNLKYMVTGNMYSLKDVKSINTLIKLQNKEMVTVLKKIKNSSTITDSLAKAFYKTFARSFFLCMLKDRIVQHDSVNIFCMQKYIFLLYFSNLHDVAKFKYTQNVDVNTKFGYSITIGENIVSDNFLKSYNLIYTASDLAKDELMSWFSCVLDLLNMDIKIHAESYENNKNSQYKKVSNNLDIYKRMNEESKKIFQNNLKKTQKGDTLNLDDLIKTLDIYREQLKHAEEVKQQMDNQISYADIEKRNMDLDFQRMISDVFYITQNVVSESPSAYNGGFVDMCKYLYIVSTFRQYEISPIYLNLLKEMEDANNSFYSTLRDFEEQEKNIRNGK